jgi:hypothetical protein
LPTGGSWPPRDLDTTLAIGGLVDSIASIYTRVQLFEDVGVLDADGEPLYRMKIPFEDGMTATERLATMALSVVESALVPEGVCAGGIEEVDAPDRGDTSRACVPDWHRRPDQRTSST